MPEGKYIVLKAEAMDAIAEELASTYFHAGGLVRSLVKEHTLPDAVVIRRQDVFAPPALDAYANSIRVALALAPQNGVTAQLAKIADYFHEQAVISWDANRKLPD